MVETLYFGYLTIELWEYLLLPIYIAVILLIASRVRNRHIRQEPYYRYYIPGLLVKIGGGIAVCMIYMYLYRGGDTISYYETGVAMTNLFFKSSSGYMQVLFGENVLEKVYMFDTNTGFPLRFVYLDDQTFTLVRLTAPLLFPAFKSYLLQTVLVAWLSYFGLWKLYTLFCHYFPLLYKRFAIAILFLPSVVFWGSGLLKDTVTLTAACWLVYSVFRVFIEPRRRYLYAFVGLASAWAIIEIKPYIFLALLPGLLLWVLYEPIKSIRSLAARLIVIPVVLGLSIGGGLFLLSLLGSNMSKFAVDRVLETAAVTQQDLKSENYGSNSFDIGKFDPTVEGILSKAPLAIEAGLFRPYLWESRNVVMIFSGLENTFILGMTLLLFVRIKPLRLVRIITGNPLIFFSMMFALLFAFSVGLTTANFGALVRFKIPFLPFYVSVLFVFWHLMKYKNATTPEQVKQVTAGKIVRSGLGGAKIVATN